MRKRVEKLYAKLEKSLRHVQSFTSCSYFKLPINTSNDARNITLDRFTRDYFEQIKIILTIAKSL